LVSSRTADGVLRDVELDAARGVLQRGEAGLAHHALEHHAAGDGDLDLLRLEFVVGRLAVPEVQVGGVVAGFEVVGEGRRPRRLGPLAKRRELFAALGDKLVVVADRGKSVAHRVVTVLAPGSRF
jgi:hypothetical protein